MEARDAFGNFYTLGDQTFELTVAVPPGAGAVVPSVAAQTSGKYMAGPSRLTP
jgi:hypothetical protein